MHISVFYTQKEAYNVKKEGQARYMKLSSGGGGENNIKLIA